MHTKYSFAIFIVILILRWFDEVLTDLNRPFWIFMAIRLLESSQYPSLDQFK
jgi:hypothetical protein|tara:strand:+ start:498 stop:653 length:156 start_codon:yes stop_codon:yes gene_type:complete